LDLVVGLGEIGAPIYEILKERGIDVDGFDLKSPTKLKQDKYDFVHICIPFTDASKFADIVRMYSQLGQIVIHSTVAPGTSRKLNAIYSPVRGVHARMFEDLHYYTKYYSGPKNPEFEKRFEKTKNVPNSVVLENTKHYVDTEYYGWLIAYPRLVPVEVDWSFAEEIHKKLGNRPIMYNDEKPIGGHCVLPNLELVDSTIISRLIKDASEKYE